MIAVNSFISFTLIKLGIMNDISILTVEDMVSGVLVNYHPSYSTFFKVKISVSFYIRHCLCPML